MKKIIPVIFLTSLTFSCSKTDDGQQDILQVDCSYYPQTTESIVCNGTLCQNDTCQTYFAIWKDLFMTKNQISQEYFDTHITPCNSILHYWNDGISYRITYKIKIDWAETKLNDKFIIWLSPSTEGLYPLLNLSRNVLLPKDQIETAIDNLAFASAMYNVSPVNSLKYSSRIEAMKALIQASGVDTLCTSTIYYIKPNRDSTPNGHPFLEASGVLDWDENKCITSSLDLITGESIVNHTHCYILFCFTEGTQITLNNNTTKSIEDINIGDTILSVNIQTLRVENDIIRQIDSAIHRNIVHINFSDLSKCENTFDHPYYVKSKGWSSYKPSETMHKYNFKAKQLQIGDTCFKYLDNKLIEVQVKTIRENIGDAMTYNISRLKKNKNFFANGILVSNEDN